MPAGRIQKSHSPKDVPDLGDPDRKRMLNVLAQRRYREFQMSTSLKSKLTSRTGQRRREKIAALEAQSKGLEGLVEQRNLRPPVAREEDDDGRWPSMNSFGTSSSVSQSKAITQLVQDLDDFQDGGGLIVHGNSVTWGQGNEFVEEAWEVGESFYRKWWFCLDEKIVAQSNRQRQERGLGRLRLTV
ncbi:hypothetical protein N0V86_003126 [Didymella sp. IMI 355093]|nr:hypothetical protein N0V86_003126 [Didymella sp. IMI 355093]